MAELKEAGESTWRMNSGMAGRLRQFIRNNRRSRPIRLLATVAEKYLRAYYNEGFYDFESNGEAFSLKVFGRWWGDRPIVIWDVGAHVGDWAMLARQALHAAHVHSFEILPPIADRLTENLGDTVWSSLHRIGLSDEAGEVEVTWNRDCDTTNSIAMRSMGVPGGDYSTVRCPVSTVDALIADGLPPPAFLKIDTEGHDAAVLRGAEALLRSPHAPAMIQFEYGVTWLPSGETLEAAQLMLENAGYRLGRLYPNHVAFKPYAYPDDHFRMGNMVAVRDETLAALLANRV